MAIGSGHEVSVKLAGASSAVVDQGMTQQGATKTYYTTSASQDVWDPSVAATIDDDGTPVAAADIESIDYKMGKVTFASGYTVNGAVTMSGNVLELLDYATARSYALSLARTLLDDTVFGDSWRSRLAALIDGELGVGNLEPGLDDLDSGGGTTRLFDTLTGGTIKLIEIIPPNYTKRWRMWVRAGQETAGASPDDLLAAEFQWQTTTYDNELVAVSFDNPRGA